MHRVGALQVIQRVCTHSVVHLGNIYIADVSNNRVRKVAASTTIITTLAGSTSSGYTGDNGQATSATLRLPYSVAVDPSGSY